MKTVSLSGSPRENVGKKDAKELRLKGLVPCVAYGGKEQIHFTLDERDFKKIVFTPESHIVKLNIGGKDITALLQDVQYHPVSDRILHADFLEFESGAVVKVAIPVRTFGVSSGVLKGGSMKINMRKLIVKAVVEDIPDYIEVDITKLEIGSSVKVRDLKIDKLEFLDRPNNVVVGVKVTRVIVEEEDEEDEEGAEGEEGGEGGDAPAEGGDAAAE